MTEKLAAKVAGHADAGEEAIRRALEAALAVQRYLDAAGEKQREVVKFLTDSSAAFSAVRAAAVPPEEGEGISPPPQARAKGEGTRKPPALPGTPAEPAAVQELKQPPKDDPRGHPPGASGSRAGSFGMLLLAAGVGTLYAGPLSLPEARAMDGKALFANCDYIEASEAFREKGERHKAVECLIAGKAYDLAIADLDGDASGRADYLRGLVAEERGDESAAHALYAIARDKGDDLAPLKLKQLGKG